MIGAQIIELSRYRGLLGMLAWRDIRVRYKQSLLGITWAFLMPLIHTSVMYTIFTYGPVRVESNELGMPYWLFVLSGIVAWGLFAGTVASSLESLSRNSKLVTKIYFPREVFPLASVAGSLVDFAIASLILVPYYIYYLSTGQVRFSAMFLLLPLVLLIQITFAAGMAMFLSMANLFFRDVKYVMTFIMQLWFFATNIVYPIRFREHPGLSWIASVNPMIPILDAYRNILAGAPLENPVGLGISAVIAVATLVFGWSVFHRASFKFAEYV